MARRITKGIAGIASPARSLLDPYPAYCLLRIDCLLIAAFGATVSEKLRA